MTLIKQGKKKMKICHSDMDFKKSFKFELAKQTICCPKHGDIEVEIPKFKSKMFENLKCPVCENEQQEEKEKELLEKERLERLKYMGIRKRHFNSTFDNYQIVNEKAYKIVSELKKAVETKSNNSFLLYGKSGTGKTHLCSVAVAKLGGIYCTWEDISLEIRSSYAHTAKETEKDIMQRLFKIPFLVIDEIDKGVDSDAKKSAISNIYRERYENCLPTWLAGNCNSEWVKQMIDTSVIDRLKQGGRSLCFDWESYRPNLKD
ncbi:MAG: hypothetical protein CR988_07650 [Treponema sp.]|nr:MAG: hypothetical protein CR988_07650 [Treponema sp.]